MVLNALRNYLELASGLTEVTRQRATATAKGLLAGSGAEMVVPGAIGQVGALADEIIATSRANRELLVGLVRAEVDRTVNRLGLATQDEVAVLQRHVERLSARIERDESAGTVGAPARKSVRKVAEEGSPEEGGPEEGSPEEDSREEGSPTRRRQPRRRPSRDGSPDDGRAAGAVMTTGPSPETADPAGEADPADNLVEATHDLGAERVSELGQARQSELDLGVVSTGDERVDAALAALEGLVGQPVDEPPRASTSGVHHGLQAALADVPDPNG